MAALVVPVEGPVAAVEEEEEEVVAEEEAKEELEEEAKCSPLLLSPPLRRCTTWASPRGPLLTEVATEALPLRSAAPP
jgi:hypothetical protein